MEVTPDTIQDIENDLQAAHGKFLDQRGWKRTCTNASHIWLWKKEIEGEILYVNESSALSIEYSTWHEEKAQEAWDNAKPLSDCCSAGPENDEGICPECKEHCEFERIVSDDY